MIVTRNFSNSVSYFMIQAGYFLFIIRRIMKCHSFVKALHAFLFFPGQIFYPYEKGRIANG